MWEKSLNCMDEAKMSLNKKQGLKKWRLTKRLPTDLKVKEKYEKFDKIIREVLIYSVFLWH